MNNNQKCVKHSVDNRHTTVPMEDIMDVSHITNKGRHMNTKKHNYIYKKNGNHINHKNTVTDNKIFNVLVSLETRQMASWKPGT